MLSKAAAEHCKTTWELFSYKIAHEPPEYLVFTDETYYIPYNGPLIQRDSSKGDQLFSVGRSVCSLSPLFIILNVCINSFSLLPALSLDGILYAQIVHGSFNGKTSKIYLKGLLECMNPYPAPNSVLVMDDCAINHVDGIQEMCNEW